jgi:hypothetical protein
LSSPFLAYFWHSFIAFFSARSSVNMSLSILRACE